MSTKTNFGGSSLSTTIYNNTVSGLAATNAQAAIDELKLLTTNGLVSKSNKSTVVSKTLSTASWSGTSAPYTYNLTVTGVTTTSVQELLPSTSITSAQLSALQAANIQDGGQAVGQISLYAFGTKPTIDIPVRVVLRGDM